MKNFNRPYFKNDKNLNNMKIRFLALVNIYNPFILFGTTLNIIWDIEKSIKITIFWILFRQKSKNIKNLQKKITCNY